MVWVLDIVVQVGLMFVSVRVCGLSYGVGFTISGVGLIRVVEYLSLFGSFRKIGILYLWVLIIRILLFRVPY